MWGIRRGLVTLFRVLAFLGEREEMIYMDDNLDGGCQTILGVWFSQDTKRGVYHEKLSPIPRYIYTPDKYFVESNHSYFPIMYPLATVILTVLSRDRGP